MTNRNRIPTFLPKMIFNIKLFIIILVIPVKRKPINIAKPPNKNCEA